MTDTNDREALTTSGPEFWEREYSSGGIPSSTREGPSGSVVDFLTYAAADGIMSGTAIDVGCGGGRNSLYLAERGFDVVAMDFTPSRIALLNERASERRLADRLKAVVHDVRKAWPVNPGTASLAVDAFCFKHQIEVSALTAYARSARATMCTGGLLMVSFAGRADGYYAQFPTDDHSGPGVVIVDPGNGIASRLYEPAEVVALFDGFSLAHSVSKTAENEMHGERFNRSTHAVYLRREATP